MSLKVVKIMLSCLLLAGLCFPTTFNAVNISGLFLGQVWALSSESMPLTSNIFVDIAKKQNRAVVSVSMKAKPT